MQKLTVKQSLWVQISFDIISESALERCLTNIQAIDAGSPMTDKNGRLMTGTENKELKYNLVSDFFDIYPITGTSEKSDIFIINASKVNRDKRIVSLVVVFDKG